MNGGGKKKIVGVTKFGTSKDRWFTRMDDKNASPRELNTNPKMEFQKFFEDWKKSRDK